MRRRVFLSTFATTMVAACSGARPPAPDSASPAGRGTDGASVPDPSSSSDPSARPSASPTRTTTAARRARRRLVPDTSGRFRFSGSRAVAEHPIKVWYRVPHGDLANARVLVVMAGINRNAKDYLDDWKDVVDTHRVIVLAPEFDDRWYPGPHLYNYGGMVDADGGARPKSRWTLGVPFALFEAVREDAGLSASQFSLFGHSAGAQFAHRLALFRPSAQLQRVVSANAGWYTFPDRSAQFPYGLANAPAVFNARAAFSTDLVVMLGNNDTDDEAEFLRHDEQADRQGLNRQERGERFLAAARAAAERAGAPCAWRLVGVPDTAHNHSGMARAAAPLLFG